MKECNACKKQLELSSFYIVQKRNQPIVYHICKECCAEQKSKAKDYYRDWELKKKYGISLEEYRTLSAAQENSCGICKTPVKSLHVDHCHETGKIRGLLCGPCNRGLGLFKDTKDLLQKALSYLEKHEDSLYSRLSS